MYKHCYIVEYLDRESGVRTRERYLFPNDAAIRLEQVRSAGFYSAALTRRRIHATGPATDTAPGIFKNGTAIAGQEFKLTKDNRR